RGVHTAGMMDILMQEGICFDCVIGVSAGTLNSFSFLTRQIGRSAKINIEYMSDPRYFSRRRMLSRKSAFGFDFMFGELSRELVPLDFEALDAAPERFFITTTDIDTAEPVYFEKGVCSDIFRAGAASASMPLVSPPVELDGHICLDGGIADAVPYRKAMEDGYEKVVVLLTRHKGYRKQPLSAGTQALYRRLFRRRPALLKKMLTVPQRYNEKMAEIDRLESEGRLFVMRPSYPITIPRMEQDQKKLQALYRQGLADGKDQLDALLQYLSQA
ncbi:MAG: patatin family protein, partial [Clostridiales bacterium]|nr:patatin family protein [Clostridiales bacterium]